MQNEWSRERRWHAHRGQWDWFIMQQGLRMSSMRQEWRRVRRWHARSRRGGWSNFSWCLWQRSMYIITILNCTNKQMMIEYIFERWCFGRICCVLHYYFYPSFFTYWLVSPWNLVWQNSSINSPSIIFCNENYTWDVLMLKNRSILDML